MKPAYSRIHHYAVIRRPYIVENDLDEERFEVPPSEVLLPNDALGFRVQIEVTPEDLSQVGLIESEFRSEELCKLADSESPTVDCRSKNDISAFRGKVDVFVILLLETLIRSTWYLFRSGIFRGFCGCLAGGHSPFALFSPPQVVFQTRTGEEASHHGINLFYQLRKMVVRFDWCKLELSNQSIKFVQNEDRPEPVLPALPQHRDCLQGYMLEVGAADRYRAN